MERSENINELATALAKARSGIKNPPLDKENPHFRSKYATLAACRDAVESVFCEHGLTLVQSPVTRDGEAGAAWLLTHSSGQWLSGECLLPVDKKNAQGVGSALTYSRRYVLMSVAGIIGDDDDDGNAAAAAPPPAKAKAAPKKADPKPPETDWIAAATQKMRDQGAADKDDFVAMIKFLTKGSVTPKELKESQETAKMFCTTLDFFVKENPGKSIKELMGASAS
jgi:hypothetical protein